MNYSNNFYTEKTYNSQPDSSRPQCLPACIVTAMLAVLAMTAAAGAQAYEVSKDTKRNLEAQIQSLQSETGPDSDAARQSIPVPIYSVRPAKALKKLSKARATTAGVPVPSSDTTPQVSHVQEMLAPKGGSPELAGNHMPEFEADSGTKRPLTVFGPDNRRVINSLGYPYNTVGLVSTEGGSCTGTLVGPRHLMTASHCINWKNDGTMGWLRFRAANYGAYYSGEAWGTTAYHYRKVSGPTATPAETAFDFVVVILDRRLGDQLGWMGAKQYFRAWNRTPLWENIGYPGDFGGTKPVYQMGCDIMSATTQYFGGYSSLQLESLCDVMPGQSGSALYSYWSNLPSIVAITSSGSAISNSFAGGALLPAIVNEARSARP